MIYLALAILCSATIPNLFRMAQLKGCRQPPIILLNYLMCVLIVIGGFFILKEPGDLRLTDHISETKSLIFAVLIGMINGGFYYLGFYFYQKSVRASGAALSSAFGKMGIIIPILLSVFLWREYPTMLGVVGIVLALFAIFYSYFDFKSFKFNQIHPVLLVFFLFGGLGDFSNKLFQKFCLPSHEMIFLFFIFISAFLLSLKDMKGIKRITKSEWTIGLILGVPNMLTASLLIRSLYRFPAFIVFPMFSGGTIIMTTVLSAVLFKDRLTMKQISAIGMIIAALVLINL